MGITKRKKMKPSSAEDSSGVVQEAIVTQSSEPIGVQRSKPGLCSRCLHGLKYFILLILIPPFLNYAALQQEQNYLLQGNGSIYDIGGGQKLYFSCVGSGKPTVLLDAPTGSSSDVWGLLVQQLANTTKVCFYDRAGLGHSERPYQPKTEEDPNAEGTPYQKDKWQHFTVESMLDDVHRLITYSSQQVDKPFVYVGSELGALVARFYTQIYETDVSDLVLIDPLVETLFLEDEGVWSEYWFNHLIPSYQTMQISAATGITRLALILGVIDPPLHDIQGDSILLQKQKHLLCNPRHLSSVVDEHHFIKESFSQMQTVFTMKQFPDNVSISVITGNYYDEQLPSALNKLQDTKNMLHCLTKDFTSSELLLHCLTKDFTSSELSFIFKAWAKSHQNLMSDIHPTSNHIVVNGGDRKMIYKKPEALAEPIKRLIKQRRKNLNNQQS